MLTNKIYAVAGLALGLALSGSVLAASQHAHSSQPGVALEMKPNAGQKWQTDEPLRTGMAETRAAIEASLPLIHEGRFTKAEFSDLGDRVQAQVDYIVSNCKLPEDADLQLHVALTQILEGIADLKGEADQEKGAVAIVQALNAYGESFDHPGWAPLRH